jgi:hypothetical protein
VSQIKYDPTLNANAGYLDITPRPGEPLRPQDAKTFFHMLFWMLYTREGRDLMRTMKLVNGTLPADRLQALEATFDSFGVIDGARRQAVIDAHVAAESWVTANSGMPGAESERDFQEKIYLQKMSFITWCLWEDTKDHEFSMGW